jgi:regulator of protease activity HflC (stomatin/prohibitin superfamily)
MDTFFAIYIIAVLGVFFFLFGIRIIRSTERGLIERLGKYNSFAEPGFHWMIPLVDQMYRVNTTEQMVDAEQQEIITNDNLNARVDAVVYFKVLGDEESVKNSQYNVNSYPLQVVSLSRTTLRNIIGTLTLKSANSERGKINSELHRTLAEETANWGIEIVRTELKEIDPPKDVQETMNKVVKAENEKIAAIDYEMAAVLSRWETEGGSVMKRGLVLPAFIFIMMMTLGLAMLTSYATAAETAADGTKRAKIKEAEGVKQSKILEAEASAEAIRLVNEAADKYFIGNAQLLKRLEITETSLKSNTKIVVPAGTELVNVIGDMAGFLPMK